MKPFLLSALLIVLLWAAVMSYRRTTPPLSRRIRFFLTALRTAAFVFIVLILFDPHCIKHGKTEEKALVAALIDKSASMNLPSHWGKKGIRFADALKLSAELDSAIASRGGRCEKFYFSGDLISSRRDSVIADGQGTDIARSLESLYQRLQGENLSAVVLFSDGRETGEALVRKKLPEVPIFTVGLGDTNYPQDVSIRDVDYSPVVRAPSKSTIRAVFVNHGTDSRSARIYLYEKGKIVFQKYVKLSPGGRELKEEIELDVPKPGRRNLLLEIKVDGFDAEESNNRKEITIDAKKAKIKILIVDMLPGWELRFLSDFLKAEKTVSFDLLTFRQAKIAGVTKIDRDDFKSKLKGYDALVLIALKEGFPGNADAVLIKKFVMDEGKGLLVLPGIGSLFEHKRAWELLAGIMPLRGIPPFRFVLDYTEVMPGRDASTNPVTSDLVPALMQSEWQERSPLLGYYSSLLEKADAEILLETRGKRNPALVYGNVGNGRVAVLSAGPFWRWKFLPDRPDVYDQLMSRLIDVLARGEQAERFSLAIKKNVFEAGEPIDLYAEVFDRKMQPFTGVPVKAEVSQIDENGVEVPLQTMPMKREGAQSSRFKSSLSALPPGDYKVEAQALLPQHTIRSSPLRFKVSRVSVEYKDVVQDKKRLESIARSGTGDYVDSDHFSRILDMIPVEPKIKPSVSDIALRSSSLVFLAILFLLSVEWIVRKRTGMI